MSVCPIPPKGCGGCGTQWKNNKLVDCQRCSGKGEDTRSMTYEYRLALEIPMSVVQKWIQDPNWQI